MGVKIRNIEHRDIPTVVDLLGRMQEELQELDLNRETVKKAIAEAINEHVYWFLFEDSEGVPFGTCYLQSVHSYWQVEKRYYLGGFYLLPTYRGKGLFREIYTLLQKWAVQHDGVQIYAHIHKDNEKSLKAFASVGHEPVEYELHVNHWG